MISILRSPPNDLIGSTNDARPTFSPFAKIQVDSAAKFGYTIDLERSIDTSYTRSSGLPSFQAL